MDAEKISLITLVFAVVITVLIVYTQRRVFINDFSSSASKKAATT